ncbi:MAG: hypothetical protein ACYTGM_05115 [Planctomycetota bacterium]
MAILEVAALFIGIFITMQVPIAFLNAKGAALGMSADLRRVLRDGQGAADRGRLRHRGADDRHEVRRRDR